MVAFAAHAPRASANARARANSTAARDNTVRRRAGGTRVTSLRRPATRARTIETAARDRTAMIARASGASDVASADRSVAKPTANGENSFSGMDGTEWFSRNFSEQGRKFSEVFPVRYAETGPNGEATMVTIADLIQECACNHAQGIWGVGQSMPAEMAKGHLAWVCTRLHLCVRKYPKWGEKMEVSTWFEPQGKIAARRDYSITDESGVQIGEATSQWVVLNLNTRRMARIPNSVLEDFKYQALERQVMEEGYASDKLADVTEIAADQCVSPITHHVRRNDMDMNGHVNNVVYVQWILESVPQETWNGRALQEIILEYRSECNFGECITATCCEVEEQSDSYVLLHKLARGDDEIVRAKTVWTKQKTS